MDNNKLIKFILVIVVVVIAGPIALPHIMRLMPQAVTFDRAQAAFLAQGMTVDSPHPVMPPGLEAAEQMQMYVNGMIVDIYRYDNEGKIAKNIEYQRTDPGTAMVEAFNIAQSLGARPSQSTPTLAQRNGMFMLVASGPDKAVLKRIVEVFGSL